jgi:hypothetical protein
MIEEQITSREIAIGHHPEILYKCWGILNRKRGHKYMIQIQEAK